MFHCFCFNHSSSITGKNCQSLKNFLADKLAEVLLEPCQTSQREYFARKVKGLNIITFFKKALRLGDWQGFQYASKTWFSYLQISEVSPFSQSLRSRKFSHVFKLTLKNQAITDVLSKSWSKNFLKIHWKTPAMESF